MLDREPKNLKRIKSPHAEMLLGMLSSVSPQQAQKRRPAAMRRDELDSRQHLSLLRKNPCNVLTHKAEPKLHCFSKY